MELPKTKLDLKDLNLQNFFNTRQYLLLSIVLGVAAAGLLVFLFLVQLTSVFSLRSDLGAERDTLAALKNKANALQDATFLEQADNRQKIDILLPSKKPLLQLLNNIGAAAQDAQVSLVAIETSPGRIASGSAQLQSDVAQLNAALIPGATAKINGVDALTLGLTVNGTLERVNAFVKNIEQIAPISDITQLQLIALSNSLDQSDFYQAKLGITSYYFTQPVNVTVDDPLPEIQANQQVFLNNLASFQFAAEEQQQTIQGGGLSDLFNINTSEKSPLGTGP